jgi:hypothetical protein
LSKINTKWPTFYEEQNSLLTSPNSSDIGIESQNKIFRFISKDSHESLEILNKSMSSKVNLVSRNKATNENDKVKQKDKEIRKFRRSQERIKVHHEREIIRAHKLRSGGRSINLQTGDSSKHQYVLIIYSFLGNYISHANLSSNNILSQKYLDPLVRKNRQVLLQTDGEEKQ